MSEDTEYKALQKQLQELRQEVDELRCRSCTGGILSSAHLRDHAKPRTFDVREDGQNLTLEDAFKGRKWPAVGGHIIIDPFDELSLTPFSYDLSIGEWALSLRKREPSPTKLPCPFDPGETVIIMTREFVAIPPCYAATVWPRFSLVRAGVFQSMVKIDPTWYGKLGVAITNVSPRTIRLEEDLPFGTLVIYGLSQKTDLDLVKPSVVPYVETAIPDTVPLSEIQRQLRDRDNRSLRASAEITDDRKLRIKSLKQSTCEKLLNLHHAAGWHQVVRDAKQDWINKKIIGNSALGMETLAELATTPPMGDSVQLTNIDNYDVLIESLRRAAVEHGKPFDLVAGMPGTIAETLRRKMMPEIQAEITSTVYPRMVTLLFSVVGSISLIVALIALTMRFGTTRDSRADREIVGGILGLGLMVFFIVLFSIWYLYKKSHWPATKRLLAYLRKRKRKQPPMNRQR